MLKAQAEKFDSYPLSGKIKVKTFKLTNPDVVSAKVAALNAYMDTKSLKQFRTI